MKKLFLIISSLFILGSCSVDNDEPAYHFEVLPIESINLPQSFTLGETYTIEFTFIRPTNCHAYDHIIVVSEEENRTLGVKSIVFEQSDCAPLTTNNLATQQFEFKVIYNQVYQFHIWKGKDAQGNDIYDDYSIPVN